MSLTGFLFVYLLGGLTFLPLLVVSVYYFSLWYLPTVQEEGDDGIDSEESRDSKHTTLASDLSGEDDDRNSLLEKELDTGTDVYITGWLTVSREYFIYPTGGPKNSLNPPASDKNDASIDQSESAYSSLYKLVNTGRDSNGGEETNSNKQSKPKKSVSKLNKYFAVLRHGNLFLYTDSDQSNVKHVIVIAKHVVMMWPPNVTDGELFIKRSAICLAKMNKEESQLFGSSTPKDAFYLYSDNCSEKEDFYFALVRASKKADFEYSYCDPNQMAHPLHYKTPEIMELIQTLHSTDANLQTRWLNAFIGRLFLAVKDTERFENYFREKIVKKLARVRRPNFLDDIHVKKISCGHAIPYFTHPKLTELTPEGLMTVEANVTYTGNFAVEIATKAVLNLGSRFKPRDVSLVLSVTVKSIQGKVIFKIKPPPSNRIWYAFESMPKLNLHIEPVVSSKQITYTMITKAIENRFRETFKETLVLPNMDDLTFFGTSGEFYRGGIWDHGVRQPSNDADVAAQDTCKSPVPVPETNIGVSSSTDLLDTEGLRHRGHDETDSDNGSFVESPTAGASSSQPSQSLKTKESTDTMGSKSEHTQGSSSSPSSSSKPAAMFGTVKKWGTYYLKKTQERAMSDDKKEAEASVSPSSSSSSSTPPAPFKPAPAAHNFPPELMSSLQSSSPYKPAPEMKVPQKYPMPPASSENLERKKSQQKIKRKPVGSEPSKAPESTSTDITPVVATHTPTREVSSSAASAPPNLEVEEVDHNGDEDDAANRRMSVVSYDGNDGQRGLLFQSGHEV